MNVLMSLCAVLQVIEMRKLRVFAQMDKQNSVREAEERLKKEHMREISTLCSALSRTGDSPGQRDGAPKQVIMSIIYVSC